jgi:hypothetical protein
MLLAIDGSMLLAIDGSMLLTIDGSMLLVLSACIICHGWGGSRVANANGAGGWWGLCACPLAHGIRRPAGCRRPALARYGPDI